MEAPPAWTADGIVIGTEGGHEIVNNQLEKLFAAKVRVAGVWIQDWSGLVRSPFADHVWWNWQLDETLYPKEWFRSLAAKGIRVFTYASPYLSTSEVAGRQPHIYQEAKQLGYLVADATGQPYVMKQSFAKLQGASDAVMVDLLNPEAFKWWVQILRCNVLMACEPDGGPPLVHGWMNDYGEWFPLNAGVSIASDDQKILLASDVHNTYSRLSSTAARLATEGIGNATFFARSGDLHSPGEARLFWMGDQITSWDACDGMQSALIGMMSGGLSGWTLTHAEIGGYDAITLPLPGIKFKRTPELLVRWLELSIFTASVLRGHESNTINASAQLWDDDVVAYTRPLVELFRGLTPYRQSLFHDAATLGLPLVRHGVLVEPSDSTWFESTKSPRLPQHCGEGHEVGLKQFFLGDDLLVVPVFEAHSSVVDVYVPHGTWIHFWSNRSVSGPSRGRWPAPMGQPAFFYRASHGAVWTTFFEQLAQRFRQGVPSPIFWVV